MSLRIAFLAAVASAAFAVVSCGVPDPGSGDTPTLHGRTPTNQSPTNDPGETGVDMNANMGAPGPNNPPSNPPPSDPPPSNPPPANPPPDNMPPANPPPTMPPPNNQAAMLAKSMFDMNVAPVLMAKCAGAMCHGGTGTSPLKFIGTAALSQYYLTVTSYSQVVGTFDKATAPILTKISAGHFATYTPTEITNIGAWLDQEVLARMMGGTTTSTVQGPGQIAAQLVREWSGCMTLADWDQTGVAIAMAQLQSEQGPCIRCHVNGYETFWATDQSQRMFDALTTSSDFMAPYFVPDLSNMAAPKMIVNIELLTKVANGTAPFIEHPRFDINNQAFQKLNDFYTQTMAHKTATPSTCAAPRLVN
jgi:hypothetical protein